MQQSKELRFKHRKLSEKSNFLIIGVLTVSIDYSIYALLYFNSPLGVNLSKVVGFIAGSCFSFIMNGIITFNYKSISILTFFRFSLLYCTSLLINSLSNKFTLDILQSNYYDVELAFLIATTISTATNYLGMKHWVFKKNEHN